MIAKAHRWLRAAVAVAASLAFWGPDAMALSLGRVVVQSALGEPLRAEIEVLSINAEEAASIRVMAALPQSFKAAGLEYNPALATLLASLQRFPDGRAYIRLSSDRVISEPFVDLILETSWASGRIVRDYTLLFDPPSSRSAVPSSQTSAQLTIQKPSGEAIAAASVPAARTAPVPAAPASVNAAKAAKPNPLAAKAQNGTSARITVKPGDTASKIAAATRQDNVSLDQMLVALLRTNPAAFVGENVNRIKAGSIINIPTAEQAAAIPLNQATQIIVAQSRDFNGFRRKLAQSAPDTTLAAADRTASGTVEARVDDKKSAAAAPDKLTLSKGTVQKLSAEDQLAKELSARDVAIRSAEISKNISDLGKLSTPSSATSSPVPGVPVVSVASAPAVNQPALTASATAPVASMTVQRPAPVPSPPPENGILDGLIDNPLAPAAAVGLIALLALLGIYRARQRQPEEHLDSVMLANNMRPDTYFAVSGGQNIDTHIGAAASPSVSFLPSKPNDGDDADPVAEAEVYLAYGRDLQAEEILKDALRANPQRIAIHHKLLGLFAKRSDTKSFERIAKKAFLLTHGEGEDWQRMRELGLSIDPSNPRYQPDFQPPESDAAPSAPAPLEGAGPAAGSGTDSRSVPVEPSATPQVVATADLDLDLDFSLDEEPTETSASVAPTAPGKLQPVAASPRPEAAPAPNPVMMEFDLGSLSLDLDDELAPNQEIASNAPEDPLATKLALAEEFQAIGDVTGAQILMEEVVAEASGEMKLKAQRALSSLQSP